MRAAIVTAATGQGHLAAARALAEALAARGAAPDILDIGAGPPLLAALLGLYNACLRRPPRWMTGFFAAVNAARVDRVAYRIVRRWAVHELDRLRPAALLSVHPMANHGIAETLARGGMDPPLAVVLTDLAPPLWRGWAEPRATVTTSPTPEAADQLAAWGVPRARIRPAPIPVARAFRRADGRARGHRALRDLGLEAERFTIALSAGTARRPSALRAYRALAAAPDLADRIQTIVLTGGDARAAGAARRVRAPFPSAILAWRQDPETILAAADVLFTKPGGLTVAEALAAGVPLLVDACGGVMPQERGNARWVASRGVGWVVEAPEAVPALLRAVMADGWANARERARTATAGDADTVLDAVADALGLGGPAGAGPPGPQRGAAPPAAAAVAEGA